MGGVCVSGTGSAPCGEDVGPAGDVPGAASGAGAGAPVAGAGAAGPGALVEVGWAGAVDRGGAGSLSFLWGCALSGRTRGPF